MFITWYDEIGGGPPVKNIKFDYLANIVVTPIKSGLYRIRIVRNKNLVKNGGEKVVINKGAGVGPLQDEMCVSKHILAQTVRSTAVSISKALKEDKRKP